MNISNPAVVMFFLDLLLQCAESDSIKQRYCALIAVLNTAQNSIRRDKGNESRQRSTRVTHRILFAKPHV